MKFSIENSPTPTKLNEFVAGRDAGGPRGRFNNAKETIKTPSKSNDYNNDNNNNNSKNELNQEIERITTIRQPPMSARMRRLGTELPEHSQRATGAPKRRRPEAKTVFPKEALAEEELINKKRQNRNRRRKTRNIPGSKNYLPERVAYLPRKQKLSSRYAKTIFPEAKTIFRKQKLSSRRKTSRPGRLELPR